VFLATDDEVSVSRDRASFVAYLKMRAVSYLREWLTEIGTALFQYS
jgi:hypothetical protein